MGTEFSKLRPYQLDAVVACHKAPSRLAIQAPTGSGKSWIIAQYIQELKKKNPSATIILSTGFNNLVFDLYQTLNGKYGDFHVKSRVLIGRAAAICGRTGVTPPDPNYPYTEDKNLRPAANGCSKCISSCGYKSTVRQGEVLITNHSMLAVLQDKIDNLEGEVVIIIDEAHTLYGYISSYNDITVKIDHIRQLQLELVKKSLSAVKVKKFLDIAKQSGMTAELVHAMGQMYPEIIPEIDRANALFKAPKKSLYLVEEKETFRVRRFVGEKFIPKHKTLYFTATLNDFHAKYLGLTSKSILKIKTNQPQTSILNSFTVEKLKPNLDYVVSLIESKKDLRGLILSSSFADLNSYIDQVSDEVYSTNKPTEFVKKSGILYGSRRLTQGVNIPDLNYIVITKLPFPVYNDEYQKWSKYVQTFMGISSWSITMAQVESDLIQSAGRLWRKPGQEGEIYIGFYGMNYDAQLKRAVSEFFNLKIAS